MTVREAAAYYGISRRSVYKRIKDGRIKAKKVRRRWVIEDPRKEESAMQWPSYVNRRFAEKDGLTPEAFKFDQWPVSDVRFGFSDHRLREFEYACRMPADTPHANQYERDERYPSRDQRGWRKLPDPVGMALSRVKFELREADTGERFHENECDHDNGEVLGGMAVGSRKTTLWGRLPPGGSIRVRLVCYPLFYYLNEQGGAMAAYANMGQRGYFKGNEISTGVHTLSLSEYGDLFIDGKPKPKPLPPLQPIKTPEEIAAEAESERERSEIEAQQREIREREERAKRERESARKQVMALRDRYGSDEEWLLGVLGDRSLPFEIRKRCYGIAESMGIDLDAARKRREEARRREQQRRDRERRERRRAAQERQRLADEITAVKQWVDYSGAYGPEEKAAILRRVYNDPQYDRFDAAVEAVAKEWGMTL